MLLLHLCFNVKLFLKKESLNLDYILKLLMGQNLFLFSKHTHRINGETQQDTLCHL